MSTAPESTTTDTGSQHNTTSEGNNLAVSVVLFVVLFALFVGGLYVMSLYTIATWLFLAGLAMSLLSLFFTFAVIPRHLT